jgi:hypothetical protein
MSKSTQSRLRWRQLRKTPRLGGFLATMCNQVLKNRHSLGDTVDAVIFARAARKKRWICFGIVIGKEQCWLLCLRDSHCESYLDCYWCYSRRRNFAEQIIRNPCPGTRSTSNLWREHLHVPAWWLGMSIFLDGSRRNPNKFVNTLIAGRGACQSHRRACAPCCRREETSGPTMLQDVLYLANT